MAEMHTPTPPAPMPPRRQRSLLGPIVLITLGVLFLLGNMGILTWRVIGYGFAHYWPLILIAIGLIKLAEYAHARSSGSGYRGVGFGTGLLLFFVIVFGLIASQVAQVNMGALQDELGIEGDFPGLFGERFEFQDELQLKEVPAEATLRIKNERGNVHLIGGSSDLKVMVNKVVYASNDSEAKKIEERLETSLTVEGDAIVLSAPQRSGTRTDLEVYVPALVGRTQIDSGRGDVQLDDLRGEVTIENVRGDVQVHNLAGNLTVEMRNGDFLADRVVGSVNVQGRGDDLTLSQVGGQVTMEGSFYGDIRLSDISDRVRFKSSRTDLELGRLQGELVLEGGDLRATSFEGPFRLATRSKDIHIEDFSGDVKLENRNADIEVRPRLPLGNLEIENSRGPIQLVLPDKTSFRLDARTKSGDIDSEFEGIAVERSGSEVRASGTVGGGGPTLRLETAYASIEIRKGS